MAEWSNATVCKTVLWSQVRILLGAPLQNDGDKYFMHEKVWIFGDSFSDQGNIGSAQFSWPTELNKHYDVENFSLRGTGPQWSLCRLFEQIKKVECTRDINLIFFVSNPLRFNFKFYQDPVDQVAFDYLTYGATNQASERLIKPYLHFIKFIKNFNRWYLEDDLQSFTDKETLKYIGVLKLHEKLFKKILVWPVFDAVEIDVDASENFSLVNTPIAAIDPDPQLSQFGGDTRANHLSEYNHLIMIKELSNWIDHRYHIDTSKFKTS